MCFGAIVDRFVVLQLGRRSAAECAPVIWACVWLLSSMRAYMLVELIFCGTFMSAALVLAFELLVFVVFETMAPEFGPHKGGISTITFPCAVIFLFFTFLTCGSRICLFAMIFQMHVQIFSALEALVTKHVWPNTPKTYVSLRLIRCQIDG